MTRNIWLNLMKSSIWLSVSLFLITHFIFDGFSTFNEMNEHHTLKLSNSLSSTHSNLMKQVLRWLESFLWSTSKQHKWQERTHLHNTQEIFCQWFHKTLSLSIDLFLKQNDWLFKRGEKRMTDTFDVLCLNEVCLCSSWLLCYWKQKNSVRFRDCIHETHCWMWSKTTY